MIVFLSACAASDAQVAPFRDDWHMDEDAGAELGDAITLTLSGDLTFTWEINGCDFEGGGEGVWDVHGDTARLTPATGPTFSWIHHPGYDVATQEIVARIEDGKLAVQGTTDTGEAFDQTWERGADSIDCRGGAL